MRGEKSEGKRGVAKRGNIEEGEKSKRGKFLQPGGEGGGDCG